MIVLDSECFKHDWMIVWLDLNDRKTYSIVNDKEKLERMYEKYKDDVWVMYNSSYDKFIIQAILCDFDPYKMNDWIINQGRKGFEFSSLLNKFPLITYDVSVFGRSLKQLQAYMGHDIRETSVPFDIDRKLTDKEIQETLSYCKHDVHETFHVFLETVVDYETHIEVIKKFNLTLQDMSKTQTQLVAKVLGAERRTYNDEFDITIPDTLDLGKYAWLKDHYLEWSKTKTYDGMELSTTIAGVPHTLGIGGLHGAVEKYFGDGLYILADVESYYPSLMIEYDYHSRSIGSRGKKLFKSIYDNRMKLKHEGKKKEQLPYKLILNKSYGGLKDKYNALYDPVQANNICISGQLFLVDLIDKVEDICDIKFSNTDGVLLKVEPENEAEVKRRCEEWSKRTGMNLGYEYYNRVVMKDVNSYLAVAPNGSVTRKGSYVKKLSPLDNHLPIVNKAIVDYFVHGISPRITVMSSNALIDFQFITKVSNKYDFAFKVDNHGREVYNEVKVLKKGEVTTQYRGSKMQERVYRVFASLRDSDGGLFKKHKTKTTLDKTAGTPERCFIDNTDITEKTVPPILDREWYIALAEQRIKEFIGG